MKILIATNNKHKVTEFKAILSELQDIEFVTPKELGMEINPEENGSTFEENSSIKSMEFYKVSKIPVVADDSGLEVDILDKKPGIFSSRFAGDNASDKDNRIKVLQLLNEVNSNNRTARFRCVISFYDGENFELFDGSVEGTIIDEEKGNNGFGYDPIFVPENYYLTFAELDEEIKNNISHRARALEKFKEFLKKYYHNGRR